MIRYKTLFLALGLMVLTFHAFSQKKGETYFRFNFGYNFSLAGGDFGLSVVDQTDRYSQEILKGSFGQGINMGIMGGYHIVDKVSMELGYQFVPSTRVIYRKTVLDNYSVETEAKAFSHYLEIGPSYFYPWRKVDVILIGRFGLLLPVSRYVVMDSYITGNDAQNTYYFTTDQTEKFEFHFSPGFYASLGGMTEISKGISVFGELELNAGSARFKTSELTSYRWVKVQGDVEQVRELYNLSTADRYSNYYREITGEDNIPSSPDFDVDKPTDKLTQYLPFTSIGINVGIIYTFKWKDLIRVKKK